MKSYIYRYAGQLSEPRAEPERRYRSSATSSHVLLLATITATSVSKNDIIVSNSTWYFAVCDGLSCRNTAKYIQTWLRVTFCLCPVKSLIFVVFTVLNHLCEWRGLLEIATVIGYVIMVSVITHSGTSNTRKHSSRETSHCVYLVEYWYSTRETFSFGIFR